MDPWGLCVSSDSFVDQLRALKCHRMPMAMDEFVDRLRDRSLSPNAVSLTFDDGYVDNLEVAKPILDIHGVPATIFLSTGHVHGGAMFWWDELAYRLQNFTGPTLRLRILDRPHVLDLPSREIDHIGREWRAWDPPRSGRESAYATLWSALQRCGTAERDRVMECLRVASPSVECPRDMAPLSPFQAAQLRSPFVRVGAHGRTHQPLTAIDQAERLSEIGGSWQDCQQLVGGAVTGFAYPHGDRDANVMKMVRGVGFDWACSTREAAIDVDHSELYDLPRVAVGNWTGKQLIRRLQRLTF